MPVLAVVKLLVSTRPYRSEDKDSFNRQVKLRVSHQAEVKLQVSKEPEDKQGKLQVSERPVVKRDKLQVFKQPEGREDKLQVSKQPEDKQVKLQVLKRPEVKHQVLHLPAVKLKAALFKEVPKVQVDKNPRKTKVIILPYPEQQVKIIRFTPKSRKRRLNANSNNILDTTLTSKRNVKFSTSALTTGLSISYARTEPFSISSF